MKRLFCQFNLSLDIQLVLHGVTSGKNHDGAPCILCVIHAIMSGKEEEGGRGVAPGGVMMWGKQTNRTILAPTQAIKWPIRILCLRKTFKKLRKEIHFNNV